MLADPLVNPNPASVAMGPSYSRLSRRETAKQAALGPGFFFLGFFLSRASKLAGKGEERSGQLRLRIERNRAALVHRLQCETIVAWKRIRHLEPHGPLDVVEPDFRAAIGSGEDEAQTRLTVSFAQRSRHPAPV